jgi:hypothetical protein
MAGLTNFLTLCQAGFAGSAPIACGGGVVSDLFSERDRAAGMALYNLGPLIGAFHAPPPSHKPSLSSRKVLLSAPS